MYKLAVLLALVGVGAARPSLIHGVAPATYSSSVVSESKAASHQYRSDIITNPVVVAQEVVATPILQKTIPIAAVPVPQVAPALAYATAPITGTAYTRNVHQAQKDVVTGYTSQVIQPNLESVATSVQTVSKNQTESSESVQSITHTVVQTKPDVVVTKVDVPVQPPVLNEVEVRTSGVAQPAVTYSSPAVVAPVVPGYSFAAHSLAAPLTTSYAVNVAPIVSGYSLTAPLNQVTYSSPSVLAARSTVATAEIRQEAPLYTEAKLQPW